MKKMKRSLRHDLTLSLLSAVIAINSCITIGAHWPTKPPVESLYPYLPPQAIYSTDTGRVDEIDIVIEHVEEFTLYQQMIRQTVLIDCYNASGRWYTSGSGFILDSEKGIVLTANHVLKGAARVKVTTYDQRSMIDDFKTVSVQDAAWLTKLRELMFPPSTPQHNPLDPRPGIKREIERRHREMYKQKMEDQKKQEVQEKKSGLFDLPHDLIFGKKKLTNDRSKDDKGNSNTVIKQHSQQDIAILYFNKDLKAASVKFATIEPKIGDVIYVVGSPYGKTWFSTVTKGILSGKKRTSRQLAAVKMYQTDAAVLPGNSGGPWFNSKGELVAMSTGWVPSSGTIGIGVPFPEIKKIVEKI